MIAIVVAAVLAVLLAAAGTALIAPWRIDLHLHKSAASAKIDVRGRLRWAFFAWEIGGARPKVARPHAEDAAAAAPADRPSSRGGLATARALIDTPGFVRRVGALLRALARQIRPREVAIDARVGFDDPATTGMFFGAWHGLSFAAPTGRWIARVEPVWDETVIEGDVRANWSVRVIGVLWPVITFIVSPVVWRAGRAAMHARRAQLRG